MNIPFSSVLVTGVAGFIGSHISDRLVGEGLEVGVMVWYLLSSETWLVCAAQGPGLFLPPFLLEAFGSGRDFERKCPAWASEGLTILCLQLVVARGSFEKLVWEFA